MPISNREEELLATIMECRLKNDDCNAIYGCSNCEKELREYKKLVFRISVSDES